MAGRRKEPVALLKAKGKKHLTKDEIKEREEKELKTFDDDLKVPDFLDEFLHEEFYFYAKELQRLGIICNLDVNILAEYVRVKYLYNKACDMVMDCLKGLSDDSLRDVVNIQDKFFKQLIRLSVEIGFTITSRGKLVMPEKKEEEKTDDVSVMFGGVV